MIWRAGQLIPGDTLRIAVQDRSLEHGLGLFETFRTWAGRPSLLKRHLERLSRSARQLDLPLNDDELPDSQAVLDLIAANRNESAIGEDVRLRLTLTGGTVATASSASTLWMTAQPLPLPVREPGLFVTQTMRVTADDRLARHKTLNYWRKRIALAEAHDAGSDDVLCLTPDELICETCRANIFLVESSGLLTPSLDGPLLPGIMRGAVLERARQLGIPVDEEPLSIGHVRTVDEVFLTNSLRGILPIARLLDRDLPAPGPITLQIWRDILTWLESGAPTQ
jgi:branched-subunit amino acid aminotransferase/4-amino-4-deoxychorismate lyase